MSTTATKYIWLSVAILVTLLILSALLTGGVIEPAFEWAGGRNWY